MTIFAPLAMRTARMERRLSPRLGLACAALALLMLTSCLGASMDVTMRANGSGRIVVEYRVSEELESLGRFDGNERWHAIPVGRADLERSVARIQGLRIASVSSSAGGGDLVTRATLDFDNPDALLAFLDSTGTRATLAQAGGRNVLRLVVLDPSPPIESAELLSLFREVSAGYEIRFDFRLPRNASIATIPANVPEVRAQANGANVSFAVATGDLPAIADGLVVEITW